MADVIYHEDKYGFTFGPATVERLFHTPMGVEKPNVFLLVKTDREELQIKVTPTGFIRVLGVKKRAKKFEPEPTWDELVLFFGGHDPQGVAEE